MGLEVQHRHDDVRAVSEVMVTNKKKTKNSFLCPRGLSVSGVGLVKKLGPMADYGFLNGVNGDRDRGHDYWDPYGECGCCER